MINPDEKLLLMIKSILQDHKGKANRITSAQVSKKIDFQNDEATHFKIRDLIKKCAINYNLPVVADTRGYFLASTQKEVDDYVKNLKSRVAGINKRIEIITDNYDRISNKKRSN